MQYLIAVSVGLEGAVVTHANVLSLLLRKLRHLSTQSWQTKGGNLLVELLWQEVDIVLVGLGLLPILQQIKLGQDLVREGARHHERGVACGQPKFNNLPEAKTMTPW